jgi:hypothetical protein
MNNGVLSRLEQVVKVIRNTMRLWEMSPKRVPLHIALENVNAGWNNFQKRLSECDIIKRYANEKDIVYFIFTLTYDMYMSPQTNMESCFNTFSIKITKQMFDLLCTHDTQYHEMYINAMKSENKEKPSRIFGIVEIFLSGDNDVKKSMYVCREEEDMRKMTMTDMAELTRLKFPDITEEKLQSIVKFMEHSRDFLNLHPEIAKEFFEEYICDHKDSFHEYIANVSINTRTCSACNRRGIRLKTCSVCAAVWYCDVNCQKNHWKIHKPQCIRKNELLDKP